MSRLPSYERSFASHEKAKYWSKKNGDVKPENLFKQSHKKYWFDCDTCNHDFEKALSSVGAGKIGWCPYCVGQKLCEEKCIPCFNKSFASHKKAIYWSNTENGDVKPRDVFKQSNTKYWFDCDECNHSFDSALNHIVDGTWCPYCKNKKLCDKEACVPCFNKSFASHKKAIYWSNTKNGEVKPRDVFKNGDTKYYFDCPTCKHGFDSALFNIIAEKWCPYCSHKQLCEKEECVSCFNNSFASHGKAMYWCETENGSVKPRDVFKQSNDKYWFGCAICKHIFDFKLNDNTWCPYCDHSKLCEKTDCYFCFNNSFASHEKAIYWCETENGSAKPRHVFIQSNSKYWFNCDKCNDSFDCNLNNVFNGNWCPFCKNKTELKLYETLKSIYPSIIRQFKQEWCKKQTYLPFDFCIPELKIIIELDGRQHFIQVSNWASPEETYENDLFKEKCAKENGYSMVRIIQEDVFNDTYDWLSKILLSIEEIKISGNIENRYLCENNEYNKFIVADKPKLIVGA